MKNSETIELKRSSINLNPFNPKYHSNEQLKQQKKNIRKVGFLGGVVWNAVSGNLIDGHRRVLALDSINKYDGTPETDYTIKVERVELDDKTEKEQMTYMAVGNSKADFNLIAKYIDDIDALEIGISEAELEAIMELRDVEEEVMAFGEMEDIIDDFLPKEKNEEPRKIEEPTREEPKREEVFELDLKEKTNDDIVREHEEKPKMTREEVVAAKRHCDDVAERRNTKESCFIVINFDGEEEKLAFCEALGLDYSDNMVVKGIDIMTALDL